MSDRSTVVQRSPKLGFVNNTFLRGPITNFDRENLSISLELGSNAIFRNPRNRGCDHLQVKRPRPRGVGKECELGKALLCFCSLPCLKRFNDLQQKLDSICALYLIFTGFRLRPTDSV